VRCQHWLLALAVAVGGSCTDAPSSVPATTAVPLPDAAYRVPREVTRGQIIRLPPDTCLDAGTFKISMMSDAALFEEVTTAEGYTVIVRNGYGVGEQVRADVDEISIQIPADTPMGSASIDLNCYDVMGRSLHEQLFKTTVVR
jgi:hypothetical protein